MIADAFKFPEINSILRWKDLFSSFNKIALIAVAAAVIGTLVFLIAGSKKADEAPKGVRNLAESSAVSANVGINYSLRPWLRPYVSFSDSHMPPLTVQGDPYGASPGNSRGQGAEAGVKIGSEQRVSIHRRLLNEYIDRGSAEARLGLSGECGMC